MEKKAFVISIGDELLSGRRLNRDLQLISRFLAARGIKVAGEMIVPDEEEAIKRALHHALNSADIVITTGGLGPTHDDKTRWVAAEYFDRELEYREPLMEFVLKRLKDFEMEYIEGIHKNYALVPQGFDHHYNEVGIAPAMSAKIEHDGREKLVVLLPGPPREVEHLLDKLEPLFKDYSQGECREFTIKTFGIPEVDITKLLKDKNFDAFDSLSILPSPYGVQLVLKKCGEDEKEVQKWIEERVKFIEGILGKQYIYGYGDDTLEKVVGELLRQKCLRIATAESCTGGLVANLITDVPGSSDYFWGSVVAYSNEIKEQVLGIPEPLIRHFGAVSEPVALMMAEGVRRKFGVEVGISTTGIAGPTGGTPQKPVGTVYMGISIKGRTKVILRHFSADRLGVKRLTAYTLLNELRKMLIFDENP